ncbi:MAG: hypothetical protein ACTH1Z_04785 [Ancrocorticia sp.]|uniref:hypothetical protein n=1 Tax=Ancrocorticia sp. TaxID=2593684 RepID=UPI003F8DCDF3
MSNVVALRESDGETRAALTPETVRALVRGGHRVVVQSGIGTRSFYSDPEYEDAGAHVREGAPLATALGEADLLAHVAPLTAERLALLGKGAITLGLLGALDDERRAAFASAGVQPLAFEQLPRTSRAQSMDVLSSQALAAGYRSVLEAATRLPRFLPMSMTAAGTVPPAKVVVLGVGVAGLQAIATARRLGATVSANDIRPSSAEEVRSVGATFIEAGVGDTQTAGGYARSLGTSDADAQKQAIAPYIAEADILITTASVPGRSAPRLVTTEMVAAMRPGSVAIDLAASTGGNVEGSRSGEDVLVPSSRGGGNVTVVGIANAPGDLPADASRLYAKNVSNVIEILTVAPDNGGEPELQINLDDDILAGLMVRVGEEEEIN